MPNSKSFNKVEELILIRHPALVAGSVKKIYTVTMTPSLPSPLGERVARSDGRGAFTSYRQQDTGTSPV